jgi:ABC-type transporter Mla MlaB component
MVTFAIRGPIARSDLPGLCERVCALLADAGQAVVCDVRGVEPDAVTVEALALLALAGRRRGCRVELRDASSQLLGLIAFLGLRDVVPVSPGAAAG